METALRVQEIIKSFDGKILFRGLSLSIARGEIAALFGPSGSGKTTLLRIIAGLEEPESGSIIFNGQEMSGIPTHQRGFGLMFQDLALFPHRDVFNNVAFGLRMQRLPREEIEQRVHELLEMVGLKNLATRDVHQLSGGEQQRVALARALAPRPRLLMFDEPLGALDRILREQLVTDLRMILKQLKVTTLYVTHDQNEAFGIADQVFIIHQGQIAQSGTPQQVYGQPVNVFVAKFLGLDNLFTGRVTRIDSVFTRVETDAGNFLITDSSPQGKSSPYVLLRPDAARRIEPELELELQMRDNTIAGTVAESRFRAGQTRIDLLTKSGKSIVLDWSQPFPTGTRVVIELDPEKIMLIAGDAYDVEITDYH
jgi:ABC-type Fe3+/spermidine/putrescine transport system ATPase subunit